MWKIVTDPQGSRNQDSAGRSFSHLADILAEQTFLIIGYIGNENIYPILVDLIVAWLVDDTSTTNIGNSGSEFEIMG